jgi:hypothetical protein
MTPNVVKDTLALLLHRGRDVTERLYEQYRDSKTGLREHLTSRGVSWQEADSFLTLVNNYTSVKHHERPIRIATTQRVPEIQITHSTPPRAANEPGEEQQQAGPAAALADVMKSPCSISMDAEVDCVYLYCGHVVSCFSCLQSWIREAKSCPVCRQDCPRTLKIFAS